MLQSDLWGNGSCENLDFPDAEVQVEDKRTFPVADVTPSSGRCPRLQPLKEVPSYLSSCSLAGTQQAKGKMVSGLEAQL